MPTLVGRRMIDGMRDVCLILASHSPRRSELLAEAGYRYVVMPSQHVEECFVCSRESPAEYVARLAYEKAREVVRHLIAADVVALAKATGETNESRVYVVGCDTVAECHGEVLGKPHDELQARRMLEFISGKEHRVLSGLCVWPLRRTATGGWSADFPAGEGGSPSPERRSHLPQVKVDVTILRMDRLAEGQLREYLASGHWEGKAGAFGYQDRTGWLHVVSGSESNVVGLPLELLQRMLLELAVSR